MTSLFSAWAANSLKSDFTCSCKQNSNLWPFAKAGPRGNRFVCFVWVGVGFFAHLFFFLLILSKRQTTTMKEIDLERISIMRECLPAALGTGNIIFPAKTHSRSIWAILVTWEHLEGVTQENCSSYNSLFVSVWAIVNRSAVELELIEYMKFRQKAYVPYEKSFEQWQANIHCSQWALDVEDRSKPYGSEAETKLRKKWLFRIDQDANRYIFLRCLGNFISSKQMVDGFQPKSHFRQWDKSS